MTGPSSICDRAVTFVGTHSPIRALAFFGCMASASACTLLTTLDGLSDGDGTVAPLEGSVDSPADGLAGEGSAPDAAVDGEAGVVPSRYARAVMADAPVLYFRFGEAAGESKLRDEITGLQVPVPVTGAHIGVAGALAGDTNTAIAFDGGGHLLFPAGQEFEGLAPFTVEVWVKLAATVASVAFIVDHEDFSVGRGGWNLFGGTDGLGIERRTSDTVFNAIGTSAPAPETWHHMVATMDGTRQYIFVDGVLADNGMATASVKKIGVPYSVGGQNCVPCTGGQFIGVLDELAIYDKALPSTTIAAHFAAGR